MLSMRELSASIFLFTSNTRILSILVFDNFDNGQSQAAAAVSVLYIVVIAVLAVIAQKVGADRKLGAQVTLPKPHHLKGSKQ